KGLMIAALLTGAFMGITNETLLATALPSIQEAFSITQSEVQWLTTAFLMANGIMIPISAFLIPLAIKKAVVNHCTSTAFLMANGIMIPISAFLIERFTTRTLFLTAISIFGAGTIISALAPVFPVLLLGRIVQASGSGIMLPLL